MLKLFIGFFSLQLLIPGVVTGKNNQTLKDIYSKFKQSDYNVTVEWAELVRYTKPEMSHGKITMFKYNRTCAAVNFTMTFTVDLGYELEVIIQAYKFASNEYRLFPLRFQANVCKLIASNMIGASGFMKCGNFTGCPLRKGTFDVCNWTLDQSQFPPLMPTGRYMMEVQGMYHDKEIWFVRTYAAVTRSIVKK